MTKNKHTSTNHGTERNPIYRCIECGDSFDNINLLTDGRCMMCD